MIFKHILTELDLNNKLFYKFVIKIIPNFNWIIVELILYLKTK